MKKTIHFLLFLFFTSITLGQQTKIDSLINVLKSTYINSEKENICNELFDLIWKNDLASETDTLILNKINFIAKQTKNINLEAKSYALLTQKYMSLEDSLKSHIYISKLKKTIPNKKFEYYYNFKNLEGRVYIHFHKYQLAVDTYEEAIKEYNKSPQGSIIFDLYTNLSNSYGRLSNTEHEAKNLLKAIEYTSKFNDYDNKASSYYNLAWIYLKIQNYEKSVKYFEEGIKIINEKNLSKYKYFHHGLALAYSRWGKYEKALEHNFLALDFFRKTKNSRYEFDTLNNIAVTYNKMNNPKVGSEYALKALDIAYMINHPLAINGAKYTYAVSQKDLKNYSESLNTFLFLAKDTIGYYKKDMVFRNSLFLNLSELYEFSGNEKKAFYFFKKHKILHDSIQKTNLDSKFAELETKYQSEQKEKENLELKAKSIEQALATEKATNRNWILGLSLILLLMIALFIWKRYKSESKAKLIISSQKDEIENQKNMLLALQKELHHRMKNNLAFIDLFINLAKGKFPDKEYQLKLNELQNRLISMFEIHKQLFYSNEIASINANLYLDNLLKNIKNAYKKEGISIINKTNEKENIPAYNAFPFGLIVNEFVTNSCKYAFDENKNGTINVEFISDEGEYTLSLSDDGKGLPNDFDLNNLDSFGLEIIQLLTKEYHGKFEINGNNGVSMKITLPKNTD